MSAAEFLKGQCEHCGNSIEFPANSLGHTTACPHCGQSTLLQATTESHADPHGARKSSALFVSVIVVALVAIGGFIAAKAFRMGDSAGTTATPAPTTDPAAVSSSETNRSPDPISAATTPAPKSLADLKAGPVTFEKTKGSSLVYAVGVLRNASDHQRFGVNIELELTDARGNKVGTAKDYRAVLEPRQEWRFRALVLDSKATAASVSSIREE